MITVLLVLAIFLIIVGVLVAFAFQARNAAQQAPQRGPQTFDPNELLQRRTILIEGAIGDDLANLVVAQLLFLEEEDRMAPIHMWIDSPGGNVVAALAILKTMDFVRCPVHTTSYQRAHGMATLILANGEAGQRTVGIAARLSLEPLLPGPGPVVPEARREMDELLEELVALLVRKTKRDALAWHHDLTVGRSFGAQQAVEDGIVDRISAEDTVHPSSGRYKHSCRTLARVERKDGDRIY